MYLENEYLLNNLVLRLLSLRWTSGGGGGGDFAYERGGDARLKFWIKPLKETNRGVARAFLDP